MKTQGSGEKGKMEQKTEPLGEALITSWVRLTSTLKNSRLTQGLNYNEAIVMNIAYRRYREDGEGLVAFKEIVKETKMLKSLVNRTIDSLGEKGLLERAEGADKRTTFVRPVKEKLGEFLSVHEQSLSIAQSVVDIIGEEDARTFVRITERIVAADPLSSERE